MLSRSIALIEAPSSLGLAPPSAGTVPGVGRMADCLRELRLRERLGAMDAGRVVPPAYSPDRDAVTGIRNQREIADYSLALARAVGAQVDMDRFTLVIGGDCSILLGCLLALHRRGRYGLVFVDGHEDLQTPAISRTGGAAGMDLALSLGIGPPELAALGDSPLVQATDVALLGPRDDPRWYTGDDVRRARDAMLLMLLGDLREVGISIAGENVARRLARSGVRGAWIHLDVDVIDDALMPAVDSRQPGGLSYVDLADLLRPILATERIVGMDVTIYDPDRDSDGSAGRALVDGLVALLAG